MNPENLLYTESHEWIEKEGEIRYMGITDHAQESMGDVVFVDFCDIGFSFKKGEEVMAIESPKAASSIYAPVSGEVVEINTELEENPELLNNSPYEKGWLIKIKITEENDDLLKYQDYIETY